MILFFDIIDVTDELTDEFAAEILSESKSELEAVMLISIDKVQVTIILAVNLLGIRFA